MRFSEIIEQQQLKDHVQHALRTGRVSHAMLFSGDEGMGKKMFARTFAQAILCENRQDAGGMIEPCGECHSCVMAMAGTHPDLRELVHEKATYGVDEIRSQLVSDIELKPMHGDYRIYIIPEADGMNPASQNALLKTLEEPPAYAVIMLLAERPQALLQTILSRTVELPLRPVHDEAIERFLMEKQRVPDYRAHECAAFAAGNVGRAIRFCGDDSFRNMVDGTASLLGEMDRLTTADIMERIGRILFPDAEQETGKEKKKKGLKEAGSRELGRFLDLLLMLNRDAMVYKATGESGRLVFAAQEAYDRKAAQRSWEALYKNIARIEQARERLAANVNTDMTMELLLLGMKNEV
ncbi:MAG: DNA polymerase III subunit delta' [Lachnospiraceae bacterium]|nr:DNA polymerase III subunit delta' [Lachnospiraceae bacterium]